jgi:hypothetical protein
MAVQVRSTQSERPQVFPHALTTTPVSADFASALSGRSAGPLWVLRPTGGEDSHLLSVPTDLGEDHPATHVCCQERHQAHGRAAVSLVQTHPQAPSPHTYACPSVLRHNNAGHLCDRDRDRGALMDPCST